MNKEVLTRPFPQEVVRQRQGHHGKTLNYVDIGTVLRRLHDACDVVTFEVLRHDILEDEVVVVGRLTADGVVNVDFGCSSITRGDGGVPVSIGDDLKAASSDSIKRCSRLLGCPLDLQVHAERTAGHVGTQARAAAAPHERVTSRQLAAIQGACRRQGISRDDLGARIHKRTGKSGPQYLTKSEASEILTELGDFNGQSFSPQ
jgi:hypothetical protein